MEQIHANDWISLRNAKKSPLTESVVLALERKCKKNGISVATAVQFCAEYNWIGFEYSWYLEKLKIQNENNGNYNTKQYANIHTERNTYGSTNGKISAQELLVRNYVQPITNDSASGDFTPYVEMGN